MTDRYEYERIAADLGEKIRKGIYPPGSMLPSVKDMVAHYNVSKTTVSAVFKVLADRGLVVAERGRGTMVLDRTGANPVRIRVVQNAAISAAQAQDPWEVACAEQGRAGSVATVAAGEETAHEDVAQLLRLPDADARVIRLYRHARLDGRPAQLQTAFYPLALFARTPVAGGMQLSDVLDAMRELGFKPATFSEKVGARGAVPEEASGLRIRPGSPVLVIERITRDEQGTPLELLRIVADPTRTQLVYDDLPLPRP